MDITLHKFPCSILSIDVQDVMGSHTVNVHGTLTKNKLSKDGKIVGQEIYSKAKLDAIGNDGHGHDHSEDEIPDINKVKKEIENQEGCQVFGHLYVNKVPGNVHISAHAYGRIVQELASIGYLKFDVSHTVNSLSFGDIKEMDIIKKKFVERALMNTLNKRSKRDVQKKAYEYYLKVSIINYFELSNFIFYIFYSIVSLLIRLSHLHILILIRIHGMLINILHQLMN